MSSPPPYHYCPLLSPRHIRLLALRPALTDSQPIVCSLKQVSLDDYDDDDGGSPLPYEALSYTWGARTGTIPIVCDESTLLVTPNCESALRHLCQMFKDRLLWIDAICIDQQSAEEKNVQVPLMGEIYSAATRAVIWLGPGLPGDAGMMMRARTVGKAVYVRVVPGLPVLSENKTRMAARLMSPEEIERVRRVCSHDWFRRIWTVQELLLAKSATFLLGRSECPSSALYTYMLLTDAIKRSSFQQGSLLHLRSQAFEAVAPDAVAGGSGWLVNETTSVKMSAEAEEDELLSLFLFISASCDTTDMRDKVYGMLGILDSVCGSSIDVPPVDYSKTLPRVFEDFTLAMVRSTGKLWPLESIAHSRAEDLPSWVPDLRDPTSVSMTWHWSGPRRRIPTCIMNRAEPSEPGCLPVRARFLDMVIEVYERMPVLRGVSNDDGAVDSKRTDCLSAWTAVAAALDLQASDDCDTFRAALAKLTPFLGYLRDRHDPPEPAAVTPRLNHPFIQTALGLDPNTSLLRAAFGLEQDRSWNGMRSRFDDQYDGAALFLTINSLIGLCKGDVRGDDRICQVEGARYPMILRPVGSLGVAAFRFVGIADVYGLDGQHVRPSRRWQKSSDPLPEDELKDIKLY